MALAQPGTGNIYSIRCSCDSTSRNIEYQYYGVISFRVLVLWPFNMLLPTCWSAMWGLSLGISLYNYDTRHYSYEPAHVHVHKYTLEVKYKTSAPLLAIYRYITTKKDITI